MFSMSEDCLEIVGMLWNIVKQSPNLSLFLTRRREHDIGECLKSIPRFSLEASCMAQDIETFNIA